MTTSYTLIDADPNELDIAANVRDNFVITEDPDFIESIAQHGALQAIFAQGYGVNWRLKS